MYSGFSIGIAKKQSLISANINLTPLLESDMVILSNTLVSKGLVASDPVSCSYFRWSSPTVIFIL